MNSTTGSSEVRCMASWRPKNSTSVLNSYTLADLAAGAGASPGQRSEGQPGLVLATGGAGLRIAAAVGCLRSAWPPGPGAAQTRARRREPLPSPAHHHRPPPLPTCWRTSRRSGSETCSGSTRGTARRARARAARARCARAA
jgi:hypothetical protein